MILEPIIYSEVSQKEKDKYRILMHIYLQGRHREQIGGHSEGRRAWDEVRE